MPGQVSLHSIKITAVNAVCVLPPDLDPSLVTITSPGTGMSVCQGRNTRKKHYDCEKETSAQKENTPARSQYIVAHS